VEAWNIERHETLKHISRACFGPVCPRSKEEFAKYKSRRICELKFELKQMRHREAMRRGEEPVDGLTIKTKLNCILDMLRWKVRNRNVFSTILPRQSIIASIKNSDAYFSGFSMIFKIKLIGPSIVLGQERGFRIPCI
jgi:hypothetical protein